MNLRNIKKLEKDGTTKNINQYPLYSGFILPSSQAVRQQILILCIVCSNHTSVAIKIKKGVIK